MTFDPNIAASSLPTGLSRYGAMLKAIGLAIDRLLSACLSGVSRSQISVFLSVEPADGLRRRYVILAECKQIAAIDARLDQPFQLFGLEWPLRHIIPRHKQIASPSLDERLMRIVRRLSRILQTLAERQQF
jgi:hypothetical protein